MCVQEQHSLHNCINPLYAVTHSRCTFFWDRIMMKNGKNSEKDETRRDNRCGVKGSLQIWNRKQETGSRTYTSWCLRQTLLSLTNCQSHVNVLESAYCNQQCFWVSMCVITDKVKGRERQKRKKTEKRWHTLLINGVCNETENTKRKLRREERSKTEGGKKRVWKVQMITHQHAKPESKKTWR